MSQKQKEYVRAIVKTPHVYNNYTVALSQTIRIVEANPIQQTLVLAMWLFGTWDGVYILANSLLSGLDKVRLPPQCLAASRHRLSYQQFQNISRQKQWEAIIPSLPMSPGDEGFFLITSTIGTLLTGKSNMSVRISASYIRDRGFVCPWGATVNGHLMIPVKKMDIRAKQALSALLSGNHFTNAKESLSTRIPIADGFAWNDVVQNVLDQWRPLIVTAFIRVCLDTASRIKCRDEAVAVLDRSVTHLSEVFKESESLLRSCWKLAAQPQGKTEVILRLLEQNLEKSMV